MDENRLFKKVSNILEDVIVSAKKEERLKKYRTLIITLCVFSIIGSAYSIYGYFNKKPPPTTDEIDKHFITDTTEKPSKPPHKYPFFSCSQRIQKRLDEAKEDSK